MERIHQNNPEPKSPCIRNCCLDDNDVCLGCFRTLNEIVGWTGSSVDEKKAILTRCKDRRELHKKTSFFE